MTSRDSWNTVWANMASSIAGHSLCSRDQVGAVIVTATNRIVSVGYNGPPAGFQHNNESCMSWCKRAQGAKYSWVMDSASPHLSGDISLENDKVYFKHHRAGLSEPPLELDTDESFAKAGFTKVRELSTDYSDCPTLHAEANALSVCDRAQREGGTIYTTSHICFPCAKLIANSGLSTVVIRPAKIAEHRTPQNSYDFLESCGLTVVVLEMDSAV